MGIRKFVCRQVHGMMIMARGVMPGALAGDAGGDLRVDVREGIDDMVVVADIPGVEPGDVAVRLVSPTELGITGVRCSETTETAPGGHVMRRERACGRMRRVVSLPADAAAGCATASLENGVLTVRLVKAERGERIPVEYPFFLPGAVRERYSCVPTHSPLLVMQ